MLPAVRKELRRILKTAKLTVDREAVAAWEKTPPTLETPAGPPYRHQLDLLGVLSTLTGKDLIIAAPQTKSQGGPEGLLRVEIGVAPPNCLGCQIARDDAGGIYTTTLLGRQDYRAVDYYSAREVAKRQQLSEFAAWVRNPTGDANLLRRLKRISLPKPGVVLPSPQAETKVELSKGTRKEELRWSIRVQRCRTIVTMSPPGRTQFQYEADHASCSAAESYAKQLVSLKRRQGFRLLDGDD